MLRVDRNVHAYQLRGNGNGWDDRGGGGTVVVVIVVVVSSAEVPVRERGGVRVHV